LSGGPSSPATAWKSELGFVALVLAAAAIAVPVAQAQDDPGFAQTYLRHLGLTPAQATAWATGVCSYVDKPASCDLSPADAALASQRLAESLGTGIAPSAPVAISAPSGFSGGDALIGAAVTAGLFLLGAAGALGIRRRREPAHG
jgi:hypothetical protein